jgi:ATP-dependent RNA helicase DDX60
VSYYAMEQVLRRSDDEVLVYIAPTKALVSQIAAEVYARFNKSYKAVGSECLLNRLRFMPITLA